MAVIVRTKRRPAFLRRALDSIAAQTLRDICVIIVSDGPADAKTRAVIDAMRGRLDVALVEHAEGRGIEAMSNAGIAASRSQFIAIHDDDDTWHPAFLAKTIAFLAAQPHFVGAISHSMRAIETVVPEGIRIDGHQPFQTRIRAVSLAELAVENLYPPISFVFRRAASEQAGGFDAQLRMLGDWDFNLRLAMIGDIGVVPEVLAFHHLRATSGNGFEANMLGIDGANYREHAAQLRNKHIRAIGSDKGLELGLLLALGGMVEAVNAGTDNALARMTRRSLV